MIDDDFDLNLDFDFESDFEMKMPETKYIEVDICGLVKKMKSKKRAVFSIQREAGQLSALIHEPPKKEECFKMLSVGGGFSSLGIIKYVAEREPIEIMYASTFRIGKRHFDVMNQLHRRGRLGKCFFLTSSTQERTDKSYDYYGYITKGCEKNGWTLKTADNHSKIILMKTEKNFYVVETSSNLNENPKMEQFSWENDEGLFDWYVQLFEQLMDL